MSINFVFSANLQKKINQMKEKTKDKIRQQNEMEKVAG